MCGRVAAHEVFYEPTPPGVHEPRPIRESGGLHGHQLDDDRMTAHSHIDALSKVDRAAERTSL